MQTGLHLLLPVQETGWEWLSLASQEYRLLSRLVQGQSPTASLTDRLAAFVQHLVGEHSPWPINSCMIFYASSEGPFSIQASAPLDPTQVSLPPEEEPMLRTFLEHVSQRLLDADAGSLFLLSGGSLPLVDGAIASTGTLWFVPLVHQGHMVGILRLLLHEEQAGWQREPGLWQRDAFRLLLDLLAATLAQALDPSSHSLNLLTLRQEPFARSIEMAIAYGLRTPLTAIQLAADNLHDPLATPKERQEDLHLLLEQLTRLNQCVTNLVTLCQMETRHLPFQRRWYPLDLLLTEVIESFHHRNTTRFIRLALPAEVPQISLDPIYIARVLTTLLSQVTRSLPDEDLMVLEVQVRDGEVLLRLPAGETTMGQEPSPNQDSWWLDFTVSTQLVAAHGGQLWLESSPQGGRDIWLRLPRRTPDEHLSQQPGERRRRRAGGVKRQTEQEKP